MVKVKKYDLWEHLNIWMVCFLLFAAVFFTTGLIIRWDRHNEIGYWLTLATVISYIFCTVIEFKSARRTAQMLNDIRENRSD